MKQIHGTIGNTVKTSNTTEKVHNYAEELRFIYESLNEVRRALGRMQDRDKLVSIVGEPAYTQPVANHLESLGKQLIGMGDIVRGWA